MAKKESKEKEIELKVKAEKIWEEHLKQLQQVVNAVNSIQFNIGKMETQKHQYLHDMTNLNERVRMLQDNLVKTYGSYDVNLTDGTINWPEEKPEPNGVEKPKGDEK